MASASSSAPALRQGVAPLRAGQGVSFFLRRLHSLTGIIPVGAFLFEHILISNATAISGPAAYARQVSFLASLPLVPLLELFGIWLPIDFHALFGFYFWFRGDGITISYPWSGNWAASPSSTSSGTRGPCVSLAWICTRILRRHLAKFKPKFSILDYSCSTWWA